MMKKEIFNQLKERFKDVASWAVWSPADEGKVSSNVGDMTVFDREDLLDTIHSDFVLVALNASVHDDRKDGYTGPWQMFHSDYKNQKDYKIRHAIKDTPLWGAYMTDVIKEYPEKDSGKLVEACNRDPKLLEDNLKTMKEELDLLDNKPILVAFGSTTYDYLKKGFGDKYKIIKLVHYSYYGSKRYSSPDSYREYVLDTLKSEAII